MKIKKVLSKICIFIGLGLVSFSAILFVKTEREETNVEISTNEILVEIFDEIEKIDPKEELIQNNSVDDDKEILVQDNLYSFVLNIPSQNLSLPIQSSWSYEKLDISPCVYQDKPLVVAAHNYRSHFGRLSNLKKGDAVSIEYFNGDMVEYKVEIVTEIHETDMAAVSDSQYDLTLFTCNYSNNSERILVGLVKK